MWKWMVEIVTMKRPSKEYLERSKNRGLQTLGPLHHHIMDRVFEHFSHHFTNEDVLNMAMESLTITNHSAIAGNPHRIKLLVIRALEGMVSTQLIEQSGSTYFRSWSANCGDKCND